MEKGQRESEGGGGRMSDGDGQVGTDLAGRNLTAHAFWSFGLRAAHAFLLRTIQGFQRRQMLKSNGRSMLPCQTLACGADQSKRGGQESVKLAMGVTCAKSLDKLR
ncbi:hypothetical protein BRADI_4g03415v3 [Brachypodium distachyon]|uniref:Uncharacterized protein n=1 Tax=Brachypodium distachyon TaxID=15368 RepID=A0A2K2CKA0_BRADI|nr:hypothetical protein BRADI_4g03415v3 [Brachypodium distachyon]